MFGRVRPCLLGTRSDPRKRRRNRYGEKENDFCVVRRTEKREVTQLVYDSWEDFLAWPLLPTGRTKHNKVYYKGPQITCTESPSTRSLVSNPTVARLYTPDFVQGKSFRYKSPCKFESAIVALLDTFRSVWVDTTA